VIQGENTVFCKKVRFSLLDPSDGLALWVNHKRVSGRPGNHNTVLNGKFISWETLQVPFTDGDWVDEELGDLEVLEGGNSTGN